MPMRAQLVQLGRIARAVLDCSAVHQIDGARVPNREDRMAGDDRRLHLFGRVVGLAIGAGGVVLVGAGVRGGIRRIGGYGVGRRGGLALARTDPEARLYTCMCRCTCGETSSHPSSRPAVSTTCRCAATQVSARLVRRFGRSRSTFPLGRSRHVRARLSLVTGRLAITPVRTPHRRRRRHPGGLRSCVRRGLAGVGRLSGAVHLARVATWIVGDTGYVSRRAPADGCGCQNSGQGR